MDAAKTIRLRFENDDRIYELPAVLLEDYPLSDDSTIKGIGYEAFKTGYEYLMSGGRSTVTKAVKKVLCLHGIYDHLLVDYEHRLTLKLKDLTKVLTSQDDIVIVSDEEIYKEIISLTSQSPKYEYIVPLVINSSNGIVQSAFINEKFPIYPLSLLDELGNNVSVREMKPKIIDQIQSGTFITKEMISDNEITEPFSLEYATCCYEFCLRITMLMFSIFISRTSRSEKLSNYLAGLYTLITRKDFGEILNGSIVIGKDKHFGFLLLQAVDCYSIRIQL